MSKASGRAQTRFVCQSCGESFLRWEGQCRACSAWNSLVETQVRSEPRPSRLAAGGGLGMPVMTRLVDVGEPERPRIPIGIGELDRVLGGGLVPGSVVLLGGDQTQGYRLELGLETFRHVLDAHPGARLLVSGRLVSDPAPTIARLGVGTAVELTGRYAQREAPDVYRQAHVLLHTKVNDPCPTAVIEAMACGVPVAYPASGGTVELVGDVGGVGVPHPDGFERDEPPPPEELAAAVSAVLADRDRYSAGARDRAVQRFALSDWLDRHAELFASLVA